MRHLHPSLIVTAFAASLSVGCGEDAADCSAWTGSWRGQFSGTADGIPFDMSIATFRLEIREDLQEGIALADEAVWVLGNGYAVEFWFAENIECGDDDEVNLARGFCTVRTPTDTSDNCAVEGTLFDDGTGSGTWFAPAPGDQSPTVTGQGSWTLSK